LIPLQSKFGGALQAIIFLAAENKTVLETSVDEKKPRAYVVWCGTKFSGLCTFWGGKDLSDIAEQN
jgi:hypothetical protein